MEFLGGSLGDINISQNMQSGVKTPRLEMGINWILFGNTERCSSYFIHPLHLAFVHCTRLHGERETTAVISALIVQHS